MSFKMSLSVVLIRQFSLRAMTLMSGPSVAVRRRPTVIKKKKRQMRIPRQRPNSSVTPESEWMTHDSRSCSANLTSGRSQCEKVLNSCESLWQNQIPSLWIFRVFLERPESNKRGK